MFTYMDLLCVSFYYISIVLPVIVFQYLMDAENLIVSLFITSKPYL
jgi:hypothetical protein